MRPGEHAHWRPITAFLVWMAVAAGIYLPCLNGPLVSDDWLFIAWNPYIQDIDAANALAWLDPTGPASAMILSYSPVLLLLEALESALFGGNLLLLHLTNVAVHALATTLFAALLIRSGLPRTWALVGGWFFLVHPANVEAVAWISQLKTGAALAFALAAVLLEPRRGVLSTLAFALGLLTKPTAAFALPVAALFRWQRSTRADGADARGWLTLAAWAVALAVFVWLGLPAAQRGVVGTPALHDDALVLARTIVANAMRYLVMAGTGVGLSAFHEPRLALAWTNPWWLAGALTVSLLGARTVIALRQGKPEGVFWTWAAVSFAPVSQLVLPLPYPTADRHLYAILPGLIGAGLLAARAAAPEGAGPRLRQAGFAAAVAWISLLGFESYVRAGLWTADRELVFDSARNFPDGRYAHLIEAQQAAADGDAQRAARALRASFERGYGEFAAIGQLPAWQRVKDDPAVRAVVRDMARASLETFERRERPAPLERIAAAQAHALLGRADEANRLYEQARAELAARGLSADRVPGSGAGGAPPPDRGLAKP